LVFGTLHTTTAPSTVSRIIDQFPADRQSQIRMMLSESLKGVVAQTLLKKNGGGRVAALEILIGNSALANLIRENKIHQIPSVMQTGQKSGMQMLNSHIFDWIEKGDVEISEAMLKAVDKEDLRLRLKTNGYDIP
jgi:twitching motility protein PilT